MLILQVLPYCLRLGTSRLLEMMYNNEGPESIETHSFIILLANIVVGLLTIGFLLLFGSVIV